MRRSLGGLLLVVGAALVALGVSTMWLDRVAFSPSADTGPTLAILGDEAIRSEIASLVATADGPVVGRSPAQLKEYIEQISQIEAGAALMTEFVRSGHARLIGDHDDPVEITAAEQVTIVRDELVALEPPIIVPVQEIGSLSVISSLVTWISILSIGVGVIAFLAGLVVRPERGEVAFAVSVGLVAFGVLLVVLGYLVPVGMLPSLSDDTWMAVFPRLATRARTVTLVAALVAVVAGVVLFIATTGQRQRRQFSTPLAVGRYREQHRWSR